MAKTILCSFLFVFGLLIAGSESEYWPFTQLIGGAMFASILLIVRNE